MADIFISYSSSDRDKVKELAEAIRQRGWSVWWDRKIPFGKSFDEIIEKELEAARCVVVVWTKTSVASDWVKTEAAEGARRRVLLPVLIDDVTIPLEFRRLQAANLTNWQPNSPDSEFDRLLTYIGELLGAPTGVGPEGADTDGPGPNSDSAVSPERSQKTAQEQTNRTASTPPIKKGHAPAERESEPKQRIPEISRQHEGQSAIQAEKRIGLPISRNVLLILGGVVILGVVVAFVPSGFTPGERPQGEPVSAPVADNQAAPEVASTILPTGTTDRLVDQASKITIPKISQGRLVLDPVTAGKDADALYVKGEQYYYGNGVQQNYAEAAKWYHKAADRDHPDAQKKLAQMYKDGVGVSKNEVESIKWEMKVLSHQQKESTKALDEMDKKAKDAISHIKGG